MIKGFKRVFELWVGDVIREEVNEREAQEYSDARS